MAPAFRVTFSHILLPLILLGCFSAGQVRGQAIDARVYDSSLHLPVTPYTSYYRTMAPVGIDSVTKPGLPFIKSASEPVLVFQYDPYYYWFRLIVSNPSEIERPLMLLLTPFGLYDGKLFQRRQRGWEEIAHTGLKYPFRQRTYQFTHSIFPFTIPPLKTDTLYLSIAAPNAYKMIGLAILTPKELKRFENSIYFVFGIIVGLLILFFVVNVSLFFIFREKLYLWYSVYIIFLFLIVMKNDLLDQEFLGLDSELAFRLTPFMVIGSFAIIILMHVVQHYVKVELIQHRFFYQLTTCLKYAIFISAIIHGVVFYKANNSRVESIAFELVKFFTLCGILITINNSIYAVTHRFRNAWFLLTGSLVFMIGSIQRMYFATTLSFLFPPTIFHIGIILETLVVTIALIYRFWWDKDRLEKQEVLIQTQTLEDVSEEIHDKVGQELSLAKLHLSSIDFTDVESASVKVTTAESLISRNLQELRHLSRTMQNGVLGAHDIRDQIEKEVMMLKQTGAFTVDFIADVAALELSNRKQLNIIYILKEIFQNIIAHSGATKVEVLVIFETPRLLLKVTDNGIGFSYTATDASYHGLHIIKKRCALLSGNFGIETSPGRGTTIAIVLPVI